MWSSKCKGINETLYKSSLEMSQIINMTNPNSSWNFNRNSYSSFQLWTNVCLLSVSTIFCENNFHTDTKYYHTIFPSVQLIIHMGSQNSKMLARPHSSLPWTVLDAHHTTKPWQIYSIVVCIKDTNKKYRYFIWNHGRKLWVVGWNLGI